MVVHEIAFSEVSMDLFNMLLNGAVGYGMGKALDVIIACTCSQRDKRRVGNRQSNHLQCSNCHRELQQFTNACDFTVNRSTKEIGHAAFSPGSRRWDWSTGGALNFKKEVLEVPFNVSVRGLRNRSVVLELVLRRHADDQIITSMKKVLTSRFDRSRWTDLTACFHESTFECDDQGVVIVDARITSEHKDVLFEDRRLIQPWRA